MEFYGISGLVNKLMRSYLEIRHQRVTIKDKLNKVSSKWKYVKHGSVTVSHLHKLFLINHKQSSQPHII
jgi:UDP-N-acetylenolpyruvoylglucosamine reductase